MAGLLDKAKTTNDTGKKEVETSKDNSGGLLSKGAPAKVVKTTTVSTTETLIDGSNDTARIIGMAGWAIILVGAILSLQGGGFGLLVVLIVLAIGIGSIVQSQRMTGNVSQTKMILSIAIAAIIAAIAIDSIILVWETLPVIL